MNESNAHHLTARSPQRGALPMVRTIFINRFFHPDLSATSQLLSELALALAAQGRQVHVITSRQLYEQAAASLPANEVMEGVVIHRIWTTRFGRGSILGRSVDYASFYASSFFWLLKLTSAGDIVVAKTDPPLISVVAVVAAQLKRGLLVNWLQDVFPEVAERLGVKTVRGLIASIAKAARNYSLRRATVNVVLGERMAAVVARIVPNPVVIHNWAVGGVYPVITKDENALCLEWGLRNEFVVAYSGNFGRAHEFETIIGAIEGLRGCGVKFLFIGGGSQLALVQEAIASRKLLEHVIFQPYQPIEALPYSLCVADVHLVTLRPSLEGLIVPSKFYGIAAAGRATLFLGDQDGEIPRLLKKHRCGYAVGSSDVSGLVELIRTLRDDPDLCREMGNRARVAAAQHFHRSTAVAKWSVLLEDIEANNVRPVEP